MRIRNRIISFVLTLALCISMTPFSALADSFPQDTEVSEEQLENGQDEFVPGFVVEALGGSYAWPVPSSSEVTQGYSAGGHEAFDIGADTATEIVAAESGIVSCVQFWDGVTLDGNQSYGNMVMITHEDGNSTLYAHMSEIALEQDQFVAKGDKIGLVGQSGHATGPHLHFEIISAQGKVNPLDYITGGAGESGPAGEEANTAEDFSAEEIPVFKVNTDSGQLYSVGEQGKLLLWALPDCRRFPRTARLRGGAFVSPAQTVPPP